MASKLSKSGRKPGLTIEQSARCRRIVAIVAHDTGIDPDAFFAASRCGVKTAQARQLAMYLCHVLSGLTMTQVGQFFRRDRTTVAHACALIEDSRDDRMIDSRIQALEDSVANNRHASRARAHTVAGGISHGY
ncbi:helix-turn-helix domain-containing protein [Pelagibacterium luteolum]|uniref:DnaA protein helix-turn-helix n=1 Tax=Pelagibacterium luteolum TaxID=440168 RepID=A0A1G7TSE4_9HYPH|nr:helix-turn-helix domain-containing protein [Pelagibacterium luteolum]SDG38092.1 dnaA protein helix-turn-helix [Pelagibacterium luteolum]